MLLWVSAVWRFLHDSAFSAFAFASCVCLGFLGWLGPLRDWQAEKKVCRGSCLSKRFFGVDFGNGKDVSIVVKNDSGLFPFVGVVEPLVALPIKRGVQGVPKEFFIPADLKVSCQKFGVCRSPSKRDPLKAKTWVCGSNFSHDDRVARCLEYCRLCRGLPSGVRGGHPI